MKKPKADPGRTRRAYDDIEVHPTALAAPMTYVVVPPDDRWTTPDWITEAIHLHRSPTAPSRLQGHDMKTRTTAARTAAPWEPPRRLPADEVEAIRRAVGAGRVDTGNFGVHLAYALQDAADPTAKAMVSKGLAVIVGGTALLTATAICAYSLEETP
jgi:hypothetical protein